MAPRNARQRKIRSPYSGGLFSCPSGCGCPDCRLRTYRSPAETVTRIVAVIAVAVAILLFLRGAR